MVKFIIFIFSIKDSCLIYVHILCKTSFIYLDHLLGESTLLNKINSYEGSFLCDLIQRTKLSFRETQTFSRYLNIFRLLDD
ncbi:P-loop NTPase fold protein, partial [Salmonella enterica]|uniref:P-loop NTPase fold protein n=1 Tax=Salmonella enterica TaxID=28901 RepID=UPI0039C5B8CA